eukprot:Colp12_sorted_trinity150504_noHs@2554
MVLIVVIGENPAVCQEVKSIHHFISVFRRWKCNVLLELELNPYSETGMRVRLMEAIDPSTEDAAASFLQGVRAFMAISLSESDCRHWLLNREQYVDLLDIGGELDEFKTLAHKYFKNQRVSSEPSLPLDQPSMTRRCWSWPGTNNIKAPLSSNLSYSLLREKNIELHNMVKRINGFIDQFEERQSELKKALQAEAKEREKALQAEAKEREKALQAEAKEREKALQAEAKEREKALQAEAKEREKALQAEA